MTPSLSVTELLELLVPLQGLDIEVQTPDSAVYRIADVSSRPDGKQIDNVPVNVVVLKLTI